MPPIGRVGTPSEVYMYHSVRVCLPALAWLAAMTVGARSEAPDVYALIVGAYHYRYPAYWLPNPGVDANKLSEVFRRRATFVFTRIDADTKETRDDIEEFIAAIKRAKKPVVALVFFGGHGIQVEGRNYILLKDVPPLGSLADVRMHTIDVDQILADVVRSGARFVGVFIDACRANPFANSVSSSGRGLAPMKAERYLPYLVPGFKISDGIPEGAAIAFSTQPGETAEDGEVGKGSPFTLSIVETLSEMPNLTFGQLFAEVERRVLIKTDGDQRPWVSSRIARDEAVFSR